MLELNDLCISLDSTQYGHIIATVNNRAAAIKLIDSVYDQLVLILSHTAQQFIPKMSARTLKCWWNDELNKLKQAAIDSHVVTWMAAGKPTTGLLVDIRRNEKYALN